MFEVQQEDCYTNAVPGRRTAVRSSSWCGEQPVNRSQQTGDVGRRRLTLAGKTPGGTLRACYADTCMPERSAVVLVASEDHGESDSYAPIFLIPVTRRAAAFWTTCSLCSSWLLTPASRLLQQSSRLLTKA